MQKRKNVTLLISFIVLSGITAMVYWFRREDNALEVAPTLFRTENLTQVDSVVLTSSAGEVVVNFNGTRWRINGRYPADRNMVDVLFATLQQAAPRRPAALKLRDSVRNDLIQHGVKVKLFSAGTLANSFIAGGNEQKTQAYFMDDDDDIPYIMTIPGYRVYVSGILELDESGWRDKYIFGFNWRNFSTLDATFTNAQDNFRISMNDGVVSVEGLPAADTTRLNDFLDDISLLTADRFISVSGDSLRSVTPVAQFVVTDIGKRQHTLAIYSPQAGAGEVTGLMNDSIPVSFDRKKVGRILHPRRYFVGN